MFSLSKRTLVILLTLILAQLSTGLTIPNESLSKESSLEERGLIERRKYNSPPQILIPSRLPGLTKVNLWKKQIRQDLRNLNKSVSTLIEQTGQLNSSFKTQIQESSQTQARRRNTFNQMSKNLQKSFTNSLITAAQLQSLNSTVFHLADNQTAITAQFRSLEATLNLTNSLLKQIAQGTQDSKGVALLDQMTNLMSYLEEGKFTHRLESLEQKIFNISVAVETIKAGVQNGLDIDAQTILPGNQSNRLEEVIKSNKETSILALENVEGNSAQEHFEAPTYFNSTKQEIQEVPVIKQEKVESAKISSLGNIRLKIKSVWSKIGFGKK